MDLFADVGRFHEKFELPHFPQARLIMPPADVFGFRFKFMNEELMEFFDAFVANDLAGMADALADLVYVALGTAHLCGLPFNEVWAEVQRANMTKERRTQDGSLDPRSKRKHSLDVVKPAGWKPPDIAGILNAHMNAD